MPFVLLLLAFVLYAQDPWAKPWFDLDPGEAAAATLCGIGAFILIAGLIAAASMHHLRIAPYDRYDILRRFSKLRRWHFYTYTAFFTAGVYILGWGWVLQETFVGPWVPLVKPAVLGPYLLGLVLSWAFFYDVDRRAHSMLWLSGETDFPNRMGYLLLNIRHNMLLLLPVFLLMVAQDVLQTIFPALRKRDEFPILTLVIFLSLMVTMTVCVPWFLRIFLGLRPLQEGDLRDHLSATARRLHFRFSDILVWNTRNMQANAMVTGLTPLIRYIVLTDRIINELSVDEIEGVFGHEVGHVKHHHMSLYSGFLMLSIVMLGGLWSFGIDLVKDHLGADWPILAATLDHPELFMVFMMIYIFLVFGLLSRNCERQADLFGCRVSSRDAFIRALEKVADINGMSREKPNIFTAWQHWTINQRVSFLRDLDADPTLEARTQRRIGLLKWSLTLGLLATIAVLLSLNPWSWLKYL